MLRARVYSMGRTATVPLMVPVVNVGYSAAMGFGCDCVWQDSEGVGRLVAGAAATEERIRASHDKSRKYIFTSTSLLYSPDHTFSAPKET